MEKQKSTKPPKLRTIVLLAEMNDGIVYQAMLSKRQESAIRSVIAALGETLNLREDPLSATLEHMEPTS